MSVRLKILAVTVAILCGPAFSLVRFARPASFEPRADLVVVLNRDLGNPLGGEIWLMDLNGKLVRRITGNNYHEEHPRFSPDGSRIVFVRNLGGIAPGIGIDPQHHEIFMYDLRSGAERQLTRNDVEDGHPEWSYDGKRIAFYSRRNHPEGKATIWIMEADGSNPRPITSLQPGDLSHTDPIWSPDGRWLAFVCHRREGTVRHSRIEKIRSDGAERVVVSSGGRPLEASAAGGDQQWGDVDPEHSPDGALIWSARRLASGRVHLFAFGAGVYYGGKAELDMSGPSPDEVVERHPRFSPDGSRIVMTRSSRKAGFKTRQVVVMDPRSSLRRFVTTREDWDAWDPSWCPCAPSGAERDGTSQLVRYQGIGEERGSRLGDHRSRGSEKVRFASAPGEPAGVKTDLRVGYEVRWDLNGPPEKVISLAFRFEGRLTGEATRETGLSLQLMDWEGKNWVTVFALSEISGEQVKLQHEIAPANFISADKREVLLRIVALGSSAASPSTLAIDHLSLDVKGN